jgi:uncharacterized protein YaaQ
MDKLVIAIVHEADAEGCLGALNGAGHRATRLRSSGGLLRSENATLLVATAEEAVPAILRILEGSTQARTIELPPVLLGRLGDWREATVHHGGATVLVLPLEGLIRLG